MVNQQLVAALGRPLEGDRRYVRTQVGQFVIREHPELLGEIFAEKARLRVEEDVRNYRRVVTLRDNALRFG
jgi:hypothetical protein